MPNSVQASAARSPAVASAAPVDSASTSRAPSVIRWLTISTAALMLVELYLIFVHAPVERQMGIVQKIFYFHVPSAYGMYIGFAVSAFASAMYLAKRQDRWDAWAVAGAEVGSIFCLIILLTGPLWGRKAWGTYWTWDPRLTTTLLAGMVYFAYIVLRSFGSTGEVEKRFAAGLAIFGILDMPIIHYSVQRWRGTHPTVITGKGGGLHPDMYPALFVGFLLFTMIGVLLLWQRARVEGLRQRALALEIEAAERGLLEES
ncbi:MAG TPA: cytochrome c biogenesis protein CcsA [Polyangiales bacterium]|nr:cytochrome c biogenesis protein CcsA [Polyangiales bacterium]